MYANMVGAKPYAQNVMEVIFVLIKNNEINVLYAHHLSPVNIARQYPLWVPTGNPTVSDVTVFSTQMLSFRENTN